MTTIYGDLNLRSHQLNMDEGHGVGGIYVNSSIVDEGAMAKHKSLKRCSVQFFPIEYRYDIYGV